MKEIDDKNLLKTLARGLAVIRSFDADHSSMTVAEVARKNRMSRASARRILLTLTYLGYMELESNHYKLTAKILEIGYPYLATLDFVEILIPFMEGVNRQVQQSCSAAILDGTEIVYVARIPSKQILSINLSVGSRLPAYCTSMGRVLLSDLSDSDLNTYFDRVEIKAFTPRTVTAPGRLRKLIRQAGRHNSAVVDQELAVSLRSLAVPVKNRQGKTLCAINIGMPVDMMETGEAVAQFLPILQKAAQNAEQLIAHLPG